jgi:hypothetical protein
MGFCMRLFAASDRVVPAGELRAPLDERGSDVQLRVAAGADDAWVQLDLTHPDGRGVGLVERYPLSAADALARVENFLGCGDDEDHRPASAFEWVRTQAGAVRAEYLVRVHADIDRDPEAADAIDRILNHLTAALGGVTHADLEGFYILAADATWQVTWNPHLTAAARGRRRVAVLDGTDWVLFEMDAADRSHREAFFRGEVPTGVVPDGRAPASFAAP